MILGILRDKYGHKEVISEFHIGERLKLDVYIPAKCIAIEYDGIQHFVYPNHFHKTKEEFNDQLNRDKRKNEICKQLGINLIRIPYDIELSSNMLFSKIEELGCGTGSELLCMYNKNGGYISIKNKEYKEQQKQKEREYRRQRYQQAKLFKQRLKEKRNV
jgi:alpha-galactosidase/6-phospho-beta-glucosidase family protein